MPKSKDAFRTISEVADWLETPAHVLRFWESKFTQVKPVKRAGGRRYYRPADMQLLGGIKKLLHDDGLTIKGAQKLLREHGVKHVAELSQPLEDDLIEHDQIPEAAFEADAQPEPIVEEPATVLSFPNRAETPAAQTEAAPAQPQVPPAPTSPEPTSTAASADQAQPEQEPAQSAADDTSIESDQPFGADALPAFLRRSPPTSAPMTEDVAQSTDQTEAQPAPPIEKVTINPIAHLEPVEKDEQDIAGETSDAPAAAKTSETETSGSESAARIPQQIFSRGMHPAPDAAEPVNTDDKAEPAPEPTPEQETVPAAAPKVAIDVPSLAKVAPELDSYSAEPGVLAALPGTRRLSPELAQQLGDKLGELRALRDRMQSH